MAPEPISGNHDLLGFDCGTPLLNDWLKHNALKNEGRSARTYAVCVGDSVVGYYCLSAGAVIRERAPKKIQRNTPEQLPVVLIGRLAVHKEFQRGGIGKGMLKDAILRAIGIANSIGIRAILVHAINDEAVAFYRPYGFVSSPVDPRTLMLPIETAIRALK